MPTIIWAFILGVEQVWIKMENIQEGWNSPLCRRLEQDPGTTEVLLNLLGTPLHQVDLCPQWVCFRTSSALTFRGRRTQDWINSVFNSALNRTYATSLTSVGFALVYLTEEPAPLYLFTCCETHKHSIFLLLEKWGIGEQVIAGLLFCRTVLGIFNRLWSD